MESLSRRSALGMAAGMLAGGMLAAEAVGGEATTEGNVDRHAASSRSVSGGEESPYKYCMSLAHARQYGESSIREHKLHDFPMSSTISAGLIVLAPGDVREPHWHPNSDEWLLVMEGQIRMTIVDGKGEASTFDCGTEDVAFTPQGFGHYVESIGHTPARLLLIHNHADFTSVNLSEWVAGGSKGVFAAALDLPARSLDNTPREKVFITGKKQ